ncbi:hypothetical protein BEL04_11080 [Mucilaginibacter sp. PPCGB 2223]|uniref:TlpA family protein disulfide reductase n=1 Tax=Mucilaginibacter sp. PPCGB 2223 TaxID=1886027 RepID=UPI000825B828|nr:TlpA disulfide reductase family protein [Mucilaginibacter sp. PPCGB 2223]OCX52042.1 hypothetical protein BEL04_11080 [Mucilaginibacter sp. PPCGB 2223]
MKYLKPYFTLFALTLLCQAYAQPKESLTYEPQRPLPGQTLAISYSPAGTPLQGKKDIRGVVYLYNNYQWQTIDLALKPTGKEQFNAALPLAKDCGAAVFKFMAGDSTDNNHDKSYVIMLGDPAGGMYNAPGAYAAWGLLRAKRFGYGIPGYFKNPQITDTAFYYWMNNEITRHPKESSEELAVPFAKGIYAYQGQAGIKRINNAITFLSQRGGEKNLMRVREIYSTVLRQKAPADSLDNLMATEFPHGSIAALRAYQKLNGERDFAKKISLSEQFLVDFPQSAADPAFDEENRISYAAVYQNIIILNAMNKNFDVLNRYIGQMPYYAVIVVYYKIIQIAHNRKDESDEKLFPYAKMLVDKMETFRNQQPSEYWYLAPSEWKKQFENDMANSFLITHVNLLKNIGKYDEALQYALQAQQTLGYKKAALNNDEVFLLNHQGRKAETDEVLIKSMYENQSSPEMIALIKDNYIHQYKSADGFDNYLQSLKNAAEAKASTAKLEMLNKEMPDWNMYDASGKLIRFKDLRGKTLVMDFWASWCVPCKASFPGMQLAVEKYRNDPDVEFYFVDTEERAPDYKAQINQFIKDNHYPFHVLFDNKLKGGSMTEEVYNSICKAFSISGIPQKLIIDKNGRLRFLAVGYKGSPSALADEIAAMVEATKKVN